MQLLENPFHILGATVRDDRRRLLQLEEERSLVLEPSACVSARAALTNPRQRLSVELAWLPGVGPSRAVEVIRAIKEHGGEVPVCGGFPPLARANILATFISGLEVPDQQTIVRCALELASSLEAIDVE